VTRRFFKFIIASAIAAAANIGSRILLGMWMNYVLSIVLAFCIGLCMAFVLNRLLVFTEAAKPLHHQMLWFIVVNLAAVVQTLCVSLLFARVFFPMLGFAWHVDTAAHAIGVAAPVITSYLGHKHFTFR
jgi:putative flippase GtrA